MGKKVKAIFIKDVDYFKKGDSKMVPLELFNTLKSRGFASEDGKEVKSSKVKKEEKGDDGSTEGDNKKE